MDMFSNICLYLQCNLKYNMGNTEDQWDLFLMDYTAWVLLKEYENKTLLFKDWTLENIPLLTNHYHHSQDGT